MNNIPCEIIQDLLPSYVDGLTNDVTNAAIEEHVESCEKCRQILEGMRDGIEKQYVPDDSDKKEIDFLKKNKKRNVKVVIFSLSAAILTLAVIVFIRFFVVGEARYDNWLDCKVTVDGKRLSVEGYPVDPAHAVSDTIITEEDGVVTISTKAVRKNFIHKGGFYIETFEAENDIHQVVLDGRVPDEGACVELGIAYANGKRCYGIKGDARSVELDMDLNPMITGCFTKLFYNLDNEELIKSLEAYLKDNDL